jgi:hypothetical protein
MAEIPVERKEKSGFPWWLIPLLLLLLLLPLLWFCTRDTAVTNTNANTNANRAGAMSNANGAMSNANNMNGASNMTGGASGASGAGNTAVVVNSANGNSGANANGAMSGGANSGAAVTDVNMFGTTTDKSTLVGRNSTLSGVRVERVLSDKVFTVKSGSGEMFVLLDDNLDSGGGKEKQIKMQSGQNVNIGGAFRSVPTAEVKDETKGGGLNSKEYAQMKGQSVYLHATSVSDVK